VDSNIEPVFPEDDQISVLPPALVAESFSYVLPSFGFQLAPEIGAQVRRVCNSVTLALLGHLTEDTLGNQTVQAEGQSGDQKLLVSKN